MHTFLKVWRAKLLPFLHTHLTQLTSQIESRKTSVHAAQLVFDAQQEAMRRMEHLPVLHQVPLVSLRAQSHQILCISVKKGRGVFS